MRNKITLKEYSKIYLSGLTDKKFIDIEDKEVKGNKRLAIFLPIYIAINKRVGNFYIPEIYKDVPLYQKMLDKKLDNDKTLDKFLNSYKSYIYMKENKKIVSNKLDNDLHSLYVKHSLTTYKLNKSFNVNLKLASEIKKNEKISSSNIYKAKLISKIMMYYK